MRFIAAFFVCLSATGCTVGEFTLENHHSDIPGDRIRGWEGTQTVILEEKMSFAPIVWFGVDNVRRVGNQFASENFSMGPLYLFLSAENGSYDSEGELIAHNRWVSGLWDILFGYYERSYVEEGVWHREKHLKFLLGLFGHSATRDGSCCSFLFIPIPVGD